MIVRGSGLRLTITMQSIAPDERAFVVADLAPLDGAPIREHQFPLLRAGQHTYETSTSCAMGCLIVDLRVKVEGAGPRLRLEFTFNKLAQTGPTGGAGRRGGLRSLDQPQPQRADHDPRGGRHESHRRVGNSNNGLRLAPPHTPADLPVLAAGGLVMLTLQINEQQRIATRWPAACRRCPVG